jgi:hypothetical protein
MGGIRDPKKRYNDVLHKVKDDVRIKKGETTWVLFEIEENAEFSIIGGLGVIFLKSLNKNGATLIIHRMTMEPIT